MGQSDLKGKAWDAFSIYIRARDGVRTTGFPDRAKCVTCPRTLAVRELQAGHYLAGRCGAILFDERCSHAQCPTCNEMLDGNRPEYDRFMLETYGQDVIDELVRLKNTVRKWHDWELVELRDRYKTMLGDLLKEHGLRAI